MAIEQATSHCMDGDIERLTRRLTERLKLHIETDRLLGEVLATIDLNRGRSLSLDDLHDSLFQTWRQRHAEIEDAMRVLRATENL